MSLRCECGFVARANDEDRVIAQARAHARQAHQVEIGTALLRPLVERQAATIRRKEKT